MLLYCQDYQLQTGEFRYTIMGRTPPDEENSPDIIDSFGGIDAYNLDYLVRICRC